LEVKNEARGITQVRNYCNQKVVERNQQVNRDWLQEERKIFEEKAGESKYIKRNQLLKYPQEILKT